MMKHLAAAILFAAIFLPGAAELPPSTQLKMLPEARIWSGREQTLPFPAPNSSWRLEAEHGRVLANGGGEEDKITVDFPPLQSEETAILYIGDNPAARVRIFPPKILQGLTARMECQQVELEKLGIIDDKKAEVGMPKFFAVRPQDHLLSRIGILSYPATIVVFTDKWDFPLDISQEWRRFSFGTLTQKGKAGLNLIYDRKTKEIDCGGDIAWIIAYHAIGDKVIVLPPDFDLNDIDNVLFLKQELTK